MHNVLRYISSATRQMDVGYPSPVYLITGEGLKIKAPTVQGNELAVLVYTSEIWVLNTQPLLTAFERKILQRTFDTR